MHAKNNPIRRQLHIFFLALLIATSCKDKPQTEQLPEEITTVDSLAWYKNSVIYTLDVEVFQDSDGDGTGDIKGLTSRLGYIDSLGADAIWLAPFQPTPNRDDGYDVTDYYGIDKRLGTLADFKVFMTEAKQRGLRVIMDLVVNHTSDEHPWFKQARADQHSPYRSWYVWSKALPENYQVGMVFPGVQTEIWSYDSVADEYYYHRFYDFQPDLNMQQEAVKKEVEKIIDYWLALGLDGFRLDAVPFFIEVPAKKGDKFEHQYQLLADMHRHIVAKTPKAIILGEANVMPEENKNYFGEHGEGMPMMFNFFVNQHLFYALATGEVKPLKKALEQTHDIPKGAQWGQFLRGHDEVDLGRLSKRERQQVYDAFGPEKNMQLYDRGIRRRLAPMLHNDRALLELAYSMLFALPSTPVMRYGDEIGMGDDLSLKERLSVRTPMQWSPARHAGFSSGSKTVRPVITSGPFGYPAVNVLTEKADAHSLLRWTRQMVGLRKACPEIGYGTWRTASQSGDEVLVLHYSWRGHELTIIHNFSPEDREVKLSAEEAGADTLHDLLGGETVMPQNSHYILRLKGYGYTWLRGAHSAKPGVR